MQFEFSKTFLVKGECPSLNAVELLQIATPNLIDIMQYQDTHLQRKKSEKKRKSPEEFLLKILKSNEMRQLAILHEESAW